MKRYLITFATAAVLFYFCCLWRNVAHAETPELLYRRLCDAAFVVCCIYGTIGIMLWTAAGGVFTGLSYGIMQVFWLFTPGYEKNKKTRPSYAEYKMMKEDRQIKVGNFLATAAVFLIASIVFLVLFEKYA